MTQPPGKLPVAGPPVGRDLLIIVMLAALFLFPSWPFRDLWTPDEPRYMEVAREMVVTGDYLVPHLNGEIYPDKPPVFFWLAAGFYRVGFGYTAGRLVAALAATGTLLLVYGFSRRFMAAPGPLIAAITTLTTVLFLEAKAGVIDPLLMFFVTASLLCGYQALQLETRRRVAWWLGFYGLAALGVLTKGPVGLTVPGLVILVYGVAHGGRVRSGWRGHLAGAVLLAAVVSSWLIPALVAGGEAYSNEIVFGQTARRLVESDSHRQPIHYYVSRYPLSFFPWSPVLLLALVEAARRWRPEPSHPRRFLLLWFGVPFVFFSLISCKRQGYLMPLLPAAGMLLGQYASSPSADDPRWQRWHRVLMGLSLGVFAVLGAAMAVALPLVPGYLRRSAKFAHLAEPVSEMVTAGAVALAIGAGVAFIALAIWGLLALRSGGRLLSGCALAALMLATSLTADLFITPHVNRIKSARFFSEASRPYLAQAERVHLFRNNLSGVYNLYTGRVSMPVLADADAIRQAGCADRRVAIIADRRPWDRMMAGRRSIWHAAVERPAGSRRMALFINWEPGPD